jgi:methyltransferase (TIGR00027 family)
MNDSDQRFRNISDTALWVAYFRAQETKRADALFRDPFAEKLAGERGFQITKALRDGTKHEWAWAARIYLFDQFVMREVQRGAELMVNLAAGLDTRPYRLEIPSNLQWVEIDLPNILSYKEEILGSARPGCRLERVSLDLSDEKVRRKCFSDLRDRASKICVITEGLLIYLTDAEVGTLARDIASELGASTWIVDLTSPAQLRMLQNTSGKQLSEIGAAFKFGPVDGPRFFVRHGWEPMDVQGFLKTAAALNRAPKELLSLLPEPEVIQGGYPWAGVCLLNRSAQFGLQSDTPSLALEK